VGDSVPPDAVVLVHERHDRLGLGRASVSDTAGWQGAIDSMLLDAPNAAVHAWRGLGITHVMWWADRGGMSPEELAREAGFARAIDQWGDGPHDPGGDRRVAALVSEPRNPGLAAQPTRIAWLGCDGDPPLGLYTPPGLTKRTPERKLSEEDVHDHALDTLADANALVTRPACGYLKDVEPELGKHFRRAIKAGDVTLWVRR
jgi:hypothetical protein